LLGVYRKMHIPDDPLFNEKYYFTPATATSTSTARRRARAERLQGMVDALREHRAC
jgi:predicted amidohydrolase